MSTASAKRSLEPNVSIELTEEETEESPNSEEPRRKGSKPGRKPLDGEAKSKRTAQNRAAQRAFRERKEKKMKDLEEKVHSLEEINQQSILETEFLRSQLMTLVTELKKYRPENQNDSQVLEYLAKTESDKDTASSEQKREQNPKDVEDNIRHKMSFTFAFPWKGEFRNAGSKSNEGADSTDNLLVQFPSPVSSSKSSLLPARNKNGPSPSMNSDDSQKDGVKKRSSSNGFTPGSSSTGWVDSFFYNDDGEELPSFSESNSTGNNTKGGNVDVMFSNQFDFNNEFDEQVSKFCAKLGEACGTKCRPVPEMLKGTSHSSSPNRSKSPWNLSNTWDTRLDGSQSQRTSLEDNLSGPSTTSSSHNNRSSPKKSSEVPFIDASLAFPEENDLFRKSETDNLFADLIDANPSEDTTTNGIRKENNISVDDHDQVRDESSDDGVVPCNGGKLLKCNEVWDRITSHPKYSDLDIDGLCQELMAKAKCSERGVVVQAEDLQSALDNR